MYIHAYRDYTCMLQLGKDQLTSECIKFTVDMVNGYDWFSP